MKNHMPGFVALIFAFALGITIGADVQFQRPATQDGFLTRAKSATGEGTTAEDVIKILTVTTEAQNRFIGRLAEKIKALEEQGPFYRANLNDVDTWPSCGKTTITWRDDRTGNMYIQPPCPTIELNDANAEGTATSFSRSDHVHTP